MNSKLCSASSMVWQHSKDQLSQRSAHLQQLVQHHSACYMHNPGPCVLLDLMLSTKLVVCHTTNNELQSCGRRGTRTDDDCILGSRAAPCTV